MSGRRSSTWSWHRCGNAASFAPAGLRNGTSAALACQVSATFSRTHTSVRRVVRASASTPCGWPVEDQSLGLGSPSGGGVVAGRGRRTDRPRVGRHRNSRQAVVRTIRAEKAVAVDARRRHQGGEAVEQLQRRQEQRTVPARTGLGALIEQAFGNQFDALRSSGAVRLAAPAELTSTSISPGAATASSTMRAASAAPARSATVATGAWRAAGIAASAASRSARLRATSATLAPAAAKACAQARPMPLDAPVTTTTWSCRVECKRSLAQLGCGCRARGGVGAAHRLAGRDTSRRRRPGLQHRAQRYFGDGSSFGASCAFQSTGPVSKRRFNWASDHALPP